jgi:hypothetical protein
MNIDLILEITDLALGLVNNVLSGTQNAASVTSVLLQILQKAVQVYEQHTGQTLDPSLIHAEATV